MTFEQFCKELDEIAAKYGYYSSLSKSVVMDMTPGYWRGYYEDGYTPQGAWDKMMSYADAATD